MVSTYHSLQPYYPQPSLGASSRSILVRSCRLPLPGQDLSITHATDKEASSRSIRVRVCSQSPFAWANHNWESSSQGSCVAHGSRTCLSIKGHCQSTHVHINMSDARGASLRSPSALDHVERRLCARRRRWRLALRTALTFLLLFACQWYIHLDVGFLTDHEIDMIRRL